MDKHLHPSTEKKLKKKKKVQIWLGAVSIATSGASICTQLKAKVPETSPHYRKTDGYCKHIITYYYNHKRSTTRIHLKLNG